MIAVEGFFIYLSRSLLRPQINCRQDYQQQRQYMLINDFHEYLLCLFPFYYGLTVIPPLMTNTVFGAKDYNCIWAYFMSAASISGAIAPPLYGFIFDVSGAYTLMYAVVITLALISLICGLIALKSRQNT